MLIQRGFLSNALMTRTVNQAFYLFFSFNDKPMNASWHANWNSTKIAIEFDITVKSALTKPFSNIRFCLVYAGVWFLQVLKEMKLDIYGFLNIHVLGFKAIRKMWVVGCNRTPLLFMKYQSYNQVQKAPGVPKIIISKIFLSTWWELPFLNTIWHPSLPKSADSPGFTWFSGLFRVLLRHVSLYTCVNSYCH